MLSQLSQQERKILVFFIGMALLGSSVIVCKRLMAPPPPEIKIVRAAPPEQTTLDGSQITVHIDGAVKRPGLYDLGAEARLMTLVKQAGLTNQADVASVNLAQKLVDGQKVVIPQKGVLGEGHQTASLVFSPVFGSKVDLNLASSEQLASLSGIGPVLAQRIVRYRLEKGFFHRIDELKNVSGIGHKKFESIRDSVKVTE